LQHEGVKDTKTHEELRGAFSLPAGARADTILVDAT